MITNKSLLCYCIQIEFTSLVRIKTLVCYLLSVGFKQAGCVGFVFPREFFVSGFTWSVRAPSVVLVWRLETAAWRHRESSPLQSSNSWLRYGFGTVLDPLRWLVPRWASSGPARVGGRSRENGKRSFDEFHSSRESRERRERGAPLARRFKQSVFWTSLKAAGPIRASVRGGAPPARLVFAKHFHVRTDNLFVPLLFKLLSCLHIYTITTFVILLIHTILQPFIKV